MKKTTLFALAIGLPCLAAAQTLKPAEAPKPPPTEFPTDAAPLGAAELKEKLAGKVFNVQLHNGGTWRLEYKNNGYFFVNASGGFNGSGQWETDGSKLCGKLRGSDASCNDVRQSGGLLYLKRDSGEVIALRPN